MEIIACGDFHLPDRQLCTPMYSLVSQKMKKIKMVALDLDGTTLNNAHNLTDRVIETLRDISVSQSVLFYISSLGIKWLYNRRI